MTGLLALSRYNSASAIKSVTLISNALAMRATETIPGFWPPRSMLLM